MQFPLTFVPLGLAVWFLGEVGASGRSGLGLLIGFVLYRLTFILHERVHGTFFAVRWLNALVGRLASGLLGVSFTNYRRIHFEHHLLYGTPADPSAPDYYGIQPGQRRMIWHFLKALFLMTVAEKLIQFTTWQIAGDPETSAREGQPPIPALDATAILVTQAAVFLVTSRWGVQPLNYLLFYVLPGLILVPFLSRLRTYLEHGEIEPAAGLRRIARTTRSWLVESELLSPVNFRFHYEHHAYPSVPASRLPHLHVILAPQIPTHEYSVSFARSLLTVLRWRWAAWADKATPAQR